jgi:selenocysteine lyase/cysteine desulfurase
MATRATQSLGNTLSRYAASCASNTSAQGMETTRTARSARASAALMASATSDPVAMRITSGAPSQSRST